MLYVDYNVQQYIIICSINEKVSTVNVHYRYCLSIIKVNLHKNASLLNYLVPTAYFGFSLTF